MREIRVLLLSITIGLLTWSVCSAGPLITLVNTDKAMYTPARTVTIFVDLENTTGDDFVGNITLSFYHLGSSVAPDQSQRLSLPYPSPPTYVQFAWTPPPDDFKGYRVEVRATDESSIMIDSSATAVDVSSDWKKFPRYSFISHYDDEIDAYNKMWKLKNYHINGVQFYDWEWKHHIPYSPAETWRDIANRLIYRRTLTSLIDAAHSYGMTAMNYNLANGAYQDYQTDQSGVQQEWGLFRSDGAQDFHGPLPAQWATQRLYQFDPANLHWQDYICRRERDVFDNLRFDGWHIDSLGSRGAMWDWDRRPINLAETFAEFVNRQQSCLGKPVVFNTVGGYGLDQIAGAGNVEFIYVELWEPSTATYNDIANLIERIRLRTPKAVVFPAYMNRRYARDTPEGTTREFNDASVRLANAAILASGASHLELGDGDAMLSTEYFPDQRLVMNESLREATKDYYDFQVAYENLLREDVQSSSHRVDLNGIPTSTQGLAGTVWTIAKSKPGFHIVHLINLEASRSSLWRDDNADRVLYPVPYTFTDISMRIYHPLLGGFDVWHASPDYAHGKAVALDFTEGSDTEGNYVSFTLPRLQYWDMIWLSSR